jgi:putative oxidoreductase
MVSPAAKQVIQPKSGGVTTLYCIDIGDDDMTFPADLFDRLARTLPHATFAHWFLRLPLALVLLQQGFDKFPLSAETAAGFGVPFLLWALAATGEIAVGVMLIAGGLLRGALGNLVTRIAGAGAAMIVAGVIYVAYWAPPLDLLLFNQFHLVLMAAGLYLALTGTGRATAQPV